MYFPVPVMGTPNPAGLAVKCGVINLFHKFPNALGTLFLLHSGSKEGISTQREKQHWQGWEGMREEITNTRKKASEGEEDKCGENRASQAQVSIYITD